MFTLAVFLNIGYEYYKNDKTYDFIKTEVLIKTENEDCTSEMTLYEDDTSTTGTDITNEYLYDESALKDINAEGIGMLVIDSIDMALPIAHTEDNSYYLTHSFDKKRNNGGSLFMDYRNRSIDDKNIIIYGHNMRNGSMFGQLSKFLKEDFLKENRDIYIYSGFERRHYVIFSVYTTSAVDNETYKTNIENSKVLFRYMSDMQNKSLYVLSLNQNAEQCLTLSTCTNDGSKRIIIQACLEK